MLLKKGSHVSITSGLYTGCHGVIRDIWLVDAGKVPQVFVEFWHGTSGVFLTLPFCAGDIEGRVITPREQEQFEIAALEQAYDFEAIPL